MDKYNAGKEPKTNGMRRCLSHERKAEWRQGQLDIHIPVRASGLILAVEREKEREWDEGRYARGKSS